MTAPVAQRFLDLAAQAEARLAPRIDRSKIRIHVGSATCEHAAGSLDVYDEFQKHIRASGREDIFLHRTGCTGRCSREPIVTVVFPGQMPVNYQRVTREKVHEIFTSHVLAGKTVTSQVLDAQAGETHKLEFLFCHAERCSRTLPVPFAELFAGKLKAAGIDESRASLIKTNCFGLCSEDKVGTSAYVLVRPSKVAYRITSEQDIDEIIVRHVGRGEIVERLKVQERPVNKGFFDLYGDVSFFNLQTRLALRNSGIIDPESIDEYIHHRGFAALAHVLERNDPERLIRKITESKLRGRGGAGFSTGQKWALARREQSAVKYVICNGDEGDPGAFMDRSMLEGDPFSVLEGLMIAGFAIGAQRGFFYVRAEYPLAVSRIQKAIDQTRCNGLLGSAILGSAFDFDIEIRLGAGAFVCGEETALIHSIEGLRGQPRIRPPYPIQSGLWGKPTVINNVETLANVPVIVEFGSRWFQQIGTAQSGGTKVFALAGKVKHTGLVEVPMGSTLRQIVFDIGGGVPGGKKLKAVQTGGPAGGCIPADCLDTPVDFDTLNKLGTIMGSGGMIVMDEDDCMVDIAKYFLSFTENESCGKCTPCREGTKRMLEILQRITRGDGVAADLEKLERLAKLIGRASLCGLGRAAPNPVLSTLRYYRAEYEAHVHEKRCPALKCAALLRYEINENCVGCTVCARQCPPHCIAGERQKRHTIHASECIRCGKCYEVCRFKAISRT
jgi:NADH:ubiquinone oxidoreductase subunit F (NADH-binding)/(2Fe-2S) ferredoxin/NAD-dependent dihydropyrimidine dehydrogenase PreA subunit